MCNVALLSCVISIAVCRLASGGTQVTDTIPLFPTDKIPGKLPPVGPEKCWQSQTGMVNTTTCANVSVPALIPFLAADSDTAVVIAPGGGFHSLALSTEGEDVARWLNSLGISAFVLKYRVPASFGYAEVPMIDAQRAVRLVRSNAARFHLNASRIGFMGFSAGGDLAAGVSANFQVRTYAKVDSIDEASCRPDFALMVYPAVHNWSSNITTQHPSAFFAQAERDPVSSANTIEYYLRLRAVSIAPSELHIYRGAIHGYGLCNVRDVSGRISVLISSPDGPGLVPAWVPWSSVCLWPEAAKAYLRDLNLLETVRSDVVI